MAWNGSTNTSAPAPEKPVPKAPSLSHGLIALVGVAVVGCGLAVWLMTGSDRKAPRAEAESKAPSAIDEVSPQLSSKQEKDSAEQKPAERPKLTWESMQGRKFKNPVANREMARRAMGEKARHFVVAPERTLFKYSSEQYLESILDMKFGEFTPDVELPPNLDSDFLESIRHPILPEPEDTPEDIEKKKMMNELKATLAERIRNGEHLADIIHAERQASNKLYEFRQQTADFVREIITEGESEESVAAFIEKANEKIVEQGGEPLELTEPMKIRIKNLARKRSKQK